MSETPRTDEAADRFPQPGQPPGAQWPEIVPAEFARWLERELAAASDQLTANHEATKLLSKWLEDEREFADRLLAIAEKAVSDHEGTLHCVDDCKCSGRRIANDNAEALAAWKEARRE